MRDGLPPGFDDWRTTEPDEPVVHRCVACNEPVHPYDTDDEARCEQCHERFVESENEASAETASDVASDYRTARSGR